MGHHLGPGTGLGGSSRSSPFCLCVGCTLQMQNLLHLGLWWGACGGQGQAGRGHRPRAHLSLVSGRNCVELLALSGNERGSTGNRGSPGNVAHSPGSQPSSPSWQSQRPEEHTRARVHIWRRERMGWAVRKEASRRLEGQHTALRQMRSLLSLSPGRWHLPSTGYTHQRSGRSEKP